MLTHNVPVNAAMPELLLLEILGNSARFLPLDRRGVVQLVACFR